MNWTSLRLAAMLAVALSFGSRPAHALDQLHSFTFSQTGYSEGATVTGAFAGIDLDGNGILVHFPESGSRADQVQRADAFSMHFSGNSLAPAFDLALDDLFGFVYQLGTNGIGDDPATDPDFGDIQEGIGAIGTNYFFTSGLGPNFVIGGYVGGEIEFEDLINVEDHALDSSPNLVLVAPVPEPPTIACLLAAAMATISLRRKLVR